MVLVLGVGPVRGADTPPAAARIIHSYKFASDDARIHCACLTIRSSCDGKLQPPPFAPDTVHQWWQAVQTTKGKEFDVAAACWRKRDAPGYGDALCCSPGIKPGGEPIPRELRNLYGATAIREAGDAEP
ncbi:MAG TPA: hypothetical protein VF310_04370 [Vicinamibacteria bacterium]